MFVSHYVLVFNSSSSNCSASFRERRGRLKSNFRNHNYYLCFVINREEALDNFANVHVRLQIVKRISRGFMIYAPDPNHLIEETNKTAGYFLTIEEGKERLKKIKQLPDLTLYMKEKKNIKYPVSSMGWREEIIRLSKKHFNFK